MIQIDKDVPIPTDRKTKYPLRVMEVGDSFFVPGKTQGQLTGTYYRLAKELNRVFVSKHLDGGVRVWRVK